MIIPFYYCGTLIVLEMWIILSDEDYECHEDVYESRIIIGHMHGQAAHQLHCPTAAA